MLIDIVLPDLGDDAEQEVTVSAWLVPQMKDVIEGDDLLEITTDKAAFCVPAPASGIVMEHRVHEDDTIKVGEVICIMNTPE